LKKLFSFYQKWKQYIVVDAVMYGAMILFILLLFLFFS